MKPDTKAEIKWVFKAKEYFYPRIEFTIDGPDILVKFIHHRERKELKNKRLRIKNYHKRLACTILSKYPNFGPHFNEGVATVWRDLDLPIYSKHILKDV